MTSSSRFVVLATALVLMSLTFGCLIYVRVHSSVGSETSLATNTSQTTGQQAGSEATGQSAATTSGSSAPLTVQKAGSTFETTIMTADLGKILVQVSLPDAPRYSEGAPVVVNVPTFYTPDKTGFEDLDGVTEAGMISLNLMFPGRSDGKGKSSEGTDDYGGPNSIKALRDVVLFAMGKTTTSDGFSLAQISEIPPLTTDVGLYAFSHPGLAATAVMGTYAADLSGLAFYVGRENPTGDTLATLELGYRQSKSGNPSDPSGVPLVNPAYSYPTDFSDSALTPDYSTARYDSTEAAPYLDLNNNRRYDSGDFLFRSGSTELFGKMYYSSRLLHALRDNGALSAPDWPKNLATPEEADAAWPSRSATTYYSELSALKSLHVMLVFAKDDHVQVVADKPHIHQAYDGFRSAGIWTRLEPDASYVTNLNAAVGRAYAEHPANTAPTNWAAATAWAYTGNNLGNSIVPLAAVLELADRTHTNTWATDISAVLTEKP